LFIRVIILFSPKQIRIQSKDRAKTAPNWKNFITFKNKVFLLKKKNGCRNLRLNVTEGFTKRLFVAQVKSQKLFSLRHKNVFRLYRTV